MKRDPDQETGLAAEKVRPEYGSHSAEEIIEAYEAAVHRIRNGYPLQTALLMNYVEDALRG